jgi:hypothetical protein
VEVLCAPLHGRSRCHRREPRVWGVRLEGPSQPKMLICGAILAASVSFCDLYKRRRCATVSFTANRVEIARCARFQSIGTSCFTVWITLIHIIRLPFGAGECSARQHKYYRHVPWSFTCSEPLQSSSLLEQMNIRNQSESTKVVVQCKIL